ncbi:DNA-binding NarL/FixJ family response regulator [Streptomyces sp. PvR034]
MSDAPASSVEVPIRVFLLDDHEVVRRGLHDLLDAEPDIEEVGEAATAEQALARGPAVRPDVAVLDVRLPDSDGITVCRELRSRMPELACLMLTSFDDEDALLDAIMAGAAGYVLKQIKGSDLVAAVRTVATGQSMLDPATTALRASYRNGQPAAQHLRPLRQVAQTAAPFAFREPDTVVGHRDRQNAVGSRDRDLCPAGTSMRGHIAERLADHRQHFIGH